MTNSSNYKFPGPCSELEDGVYATRDVFQYLICHNKQSSYESCEQDKIYDPCEKKCLSLTEVSDLFINTFTRRKYKLILWK